MFLVTLKEATSTNNDSRDDKMPRTYAHAHIVNNDSAKNLLNKLEPVEVEVSFKHLIGSQLN